MIFFNFVNIYFHHMGSNIPATLVMEIGSSVGKFDSGNATILGTSFLCNIPMNS